MELFRLLSEPTVLLVDHRAEAEHGRMVRYAANRLVDEGGVDTADRVQPGH